MVALVDAPDLVRGQMNFKRLTLIDIKIDIKRVPNKKTLIAVMEAAGIIISEMMSRASGKTTHGEENSLFK
ncbi:putative ribosomal protein L14 [Helianthus annuus]|nr:putative ribosomal protein L14 [Helianthus annuus]KAJ0630052.1 putative ribosomal protein L14 [Helianthus annuus]KAJ0720326.1 putative ribosomal protein L14 [Helianthus annuus]KAJ0723540.1 putative ribosomal protein L14 [Helianthus annuus]KAJ0899344.1 putative ribosomal protein L14 [Helianthus annuus]